MKKVILILLMGLSMTASVFGGDMAVLENLGFSADGMYFMFGQHVLLINTGQAYAETAVVDVARNSYVSGGLKRGSWKTGIWPGQSSHGALLELLNQSRELKSRYGINHVETGRLLYVRLDGDEEAGILPFRDFEEGGRLFEVDLTQRAVTGHEPSASFHIELTVTSASGAARTYSVGRPDYHRPGIRSYRIDRIWLGPNGKSLVIAVAKIGADLEIRYMVETLILQG